jgi:hypothetical protein
MDIATLPQLALFLAGVLAALPWATGAAAAPGVVGWPSSPSSLSSSLGSAATTSGRVATQRRLAFVSAPRRPLPVEIVPHRLLQAAIEVRGGADARAVAAEEDEDAAASEEEEDEEADEEEEGGGGGEEELGGAEREGEFDAALSASAVRAAAKSRAKKEASQKAASKKAVSDRLKQDGSSLTTKKKKKGVSSVVFFRVPYIVRASLNPWTVWKMTVAYWASLFNLDYLKPDASSGQNLRSALEEKAKYDGSGGKKKGRRTMKRGQAKTLSDLPRLNT